MDGMTENKSNMKQLFRYSHPFSVIPIHSKLLKLHFVTNLITKINLKKKDFPTMHAVKKKIKKMLTCTDAPLYLLDKNKYDSNIYISLYFNYKIIIK